MDALPPENSACMYVPTWKERLVWKLFPSRFVEMPDQKFEARDYLVIVTTTNLSWPDRIRVLISGRILTRTNTITENVFGRHQVESGAWVLPPKFMESKS